MPYSTRGSVRPRRKLLSAGVSVAIVALTAFLIAPAGAATVHRLHRGITFSSPSVVDPVHVYGEPDIRIAPDGTVYDSGPWGTGTQRSIWEQSTDGGRTFHPMHDTAVSSPDQSDSQIAGPGGGDTEISIDHTNKVYYADLA